MKIQIAINGFGRIGRNLFRLLINHPTIEVVAINDIADNNFCLRERVCKEKRDACKGTDERNKQNAPDIRNADVCVRSPEYCYIYRRNKDDEEPAGQSKCGSKSGITP